MKALAVQQLPSAFSPETVDQVLPSVENEMEVGELSGEARPTEGRHLPVHGGVDAPRHLHRDLNGNCWGRRLT